MEETRETEGLSAREAEVAGLYVEGLSYKEIARALEIAPGTVRTHLNAIYRSTVSSRSPAGPSSPAPSPRRRPPS